MLAGCATRFENFPLAQDQVNVERRAVDVAHEERPLVLVAVSGGGSRAAALGWVVLREVAKFRYATEGQLRSLIDDIGVVSSVSGGSVIAAHFALYGPAGLDRFAPDFLVPDNTRTLGLEAVDPITWFRLAITGSSRIDLVEQLFDHLLFKHKTFFDLNQPGKPYLILNATDMASGEVFAFTPKRFDDICSDLDKEPISAGVAASAAVPIVFSPVAFRNFSATRCPDRPTPPWITTRLNGRYAPYLNLETFKLARYANDLRHGPNRLRKKLAVIVINARADAANTISQTASRPGIAGMVESVITIPIDSTTSSVSSQMDVLLAQLNAAGGGGAGDPRFTGLKIYAVQVDFDQLRASDPHQRELREKANAIPTLWTITKDNREVLEQAGTILLHQHPCFQRLLLDMDIKADFIDAAFAKTGCRQASD